MEGNSNSTSDTISEESIENPNIIIKMPGQVARRMKELGKQEREGGVRQGWESAAVFQGPKENEMDAESR